VTRTIFVLMLAAALSACAVGPLQSSSPTQTTTAGATSGPGGGGAVISTAPSPVSGATAALLLQSQQERDAGNLGGAAATIERALSISPDDALLWVALAEIQMAQGDGALAEEMARKALTLTGPNSATATRAHRLIRN